MGGRLLVYSMLAFSFLAVILSLLVIHEVDSAGLLEAGDIAVFVFASAVYALLLAFYHFIDLKLEEVKASYGCTAQDRRA